jgi:tetratricopeptide (TPR) repeat protein
MKEVSADGVCLRCALVPGLRGADEAAGDPSTLEGYERLYELGRGAMGVVWLAREKALDRLVALKVIAPGGEPQLAQRLLREGKAVAQLSHPHIVAIHALGGSGSGTFLAMDFAEGGALDEHVGGKPVAAEAAARLIEKLADAVAHAHHAGILHRDLKPSNVLMSASGEPQLADFGLAGPLAGRGDLTRIDQVAGTPAYLAPELLGSAGAASPATDVYGLGALLYYCLTARPPFVGDSPAAILRQVADFEPVPPRLLQPGVPADLETICLKALRKSPANRYGTAADLRDDLGRYLRHEPIAARPISGWGRAMRWSRRHPNGAAALAFAASVLLLLAVGGPLVALRLERSRNAAERAAAKAEAINQFLQNDLLAQASPEAQADHDLKLQVVLDRAAARLGPRFGDQPDVEESLRATLGQTYSDITEFPAARAQFERAIALHQRLAGPDDPGTLQLRSKLIGVLVGLGKYAEAAELGRSTWETQRRRLGPEHADTLATQNAYGNALRWLGRYAEAEAVLRPLVEIRRRVAGPESRETLSAVNNLTHVLIEEGNYAAAETLATENLAIYRRTFGVENPIALQVMDSLLVTYTRSGKLPQAVAIGRETLDLSRRVFGRDNNTTLMVQNNLGLAYHDLGQIDETVGLFREMLEVRRRTTGPNSPQTLVTMNNLAACLRDQHRYLEAQSLAQQGVDGWQKLEGADHPYTLGAKNILMSIYKYSDQLGKAEALGTGLLAARQRVMGRAHINTLTTETELGDILLREGRYAEAEARLRETLELAASAAWDPIAKQITRSRLGEALLGQRKLKEAEPLLRSSAEELEKNRSKIPAYLRFEVDRARDRAARL